MKETCKNPKKEPFWVKRNDEKKEDGKKDFQNKSILNYSKDKIDFTATCKEFVFTMFYRPILDFFANEKYADAPEFFGKVIRENKSCPRSLQLLQKASIC